MRSQGVLGRSMLLISSGMTGLCDTEAQARVVHIPGICMQVTVPNDRRVCADSSLAFHYIHGVYFDVGRDQRCRDDSPTINRIGLWQETNTGDETLNDYAKINCEGAKATSIARRGARVAGLRSFSCAYPQKPYGTRLNVVGYAGNFTGRRGYPAIFYRAWMITQRSRLQQDMPKFEAFVRSARIDDRSCFAKLLR